MREGQRELLERLPGIPANYGAHRRSGGDKVAKVEVLETAVARFPYLIRRSAGRQGGNALMSKYIIRPKIWPD